MMCQAARLEPRFFSHFCTSLKTAVLHPEPMIRCDRIGLQTLDIPREHVLKSVLHSYNGFLLFQNNGTDVKDADGKQLIEHYMYVHKTYNVCFMLLKKYK